MSHGIWRKVCSYPQKYCSHLGQMKDTKRGCAKHWAQCMSHWGEQDYGPSHWHHPSCWQERRGCLEPNSPTCLFAQAKEAWQVQDQTNLDACFYAMCLPNAFFQGVQARRSSGSDLLAPLCFFKSLHWFCTQEIHLMIFLKSHLAAGRCDFAANRTPSKVSWSP